jgi:hypothetical protein
MDEDTFEEQKRDFNQLEEPYLIPFPWITNAEKVLNIVWSDKEDPELALSDPPKNILFMQNLITVESVIILHFESSSTKSKLIYNKIKVIYQFTSIHIYFRAVFASKIKVRYIFS